MLKYFLLLAGIFLPSRWYISRFEDFAGWPGVVLYVTLFGILAIALFLLSINPSRLYRGAWAIVFSVASIVAGSYREAAGEHFSYNAFLVVLEASEWIGEAVDQYRNHLLLPVVTSVMLVLGLVLSPRLQIRRGSVIHWASSLAPIASIFLLSSLLYVRGGAGAPGLPAGYATLSYLPLVVVETAQSEFGEREPVAIDVSQASVDYDVLLIIDESVRGDYLDINAADGVRTNLHNNETVFNFGLAASATNCSGGSNVILRFGGNRDNYRRYISTGPSIWAYAKKAGYRTVYIDAQRTGNKLQNYMDDGEVSEIDRFIQFDNIPILMRDLAVAELAAELTANGIPEVIVINKMGAHFPVHDKFPDHLTVFTPVLPRGKFVGVSDTGGRFGFNPKTQSDWTPYINSYKNTLLWNTGEFFATFLQKADLKNAFVVYTADHGQNFFDDESPGAIMHCSEDPPESEGIVPLTVITALEEHQKLMAESVKRNTDRVSHYNVFPTLLRLMGYDRGEIMRHYGPSLYDTVNDPRTFNSQFNSARLGRRPSWKAIRAVSTSVSSAPRHQTRHNR